MRRYLQRDTICGTYKTDRHRVIVKDVIVKDIKRLPLGTKRLAHLVWRFRWRIPLHLAVTVRTLKYKFLWTTHLKVAHVRLSVHERRGATFKGLSIMCILVGKFHRATIALHNGSQYILKVQHIKMQHAKCNVHRRKYKLWPVFCCYTHEQHRK